jgi:DNA-directed RNA polymerase subunit RPC12/RpoP
MSLNGKSLPEKNWFPSPTARDGRIRPNSANSGAGQGKGSPKRMVHCKQCGFVLDSKTNDNSGGTLDGNMGYGPYTLTNGDGVKEREVKKGAGCPLCGSKNFM